jgi:hypothetical protein
LITGAKAAVPASQIFMLLGAVALLPLILCSTGFVYWLCRSEVCEGGHQHESGIRNSDVRKRAASFFDFSRLLTS